MCGALRSRLPRLKDQLHELTELRAAHVAEAPRTGDAPASPSTASRLCERVWRAQEG